MFGGILIMKLTLTVALCIVFASISLGQTPSPTPDRTKAFGTSLEKYKNKERKNSQDNVTSGESNNNEVIKVKTDFVTSDILVTDKNGTIITNLTKDNFIATEDNTPQTIEMFSFGENASSPRSIVLIIDTGVTQLPYIKNSIQAAKILIDKLAPNDKMAIVTNHLKLLSDFTQDKILLKKALDSIQIKYQELSTGWEFSNLLAVVNEMFATEDNHRIVISQGSGNGIFEIKTDDETLQQQALSFLETRGVRVNREKYIAFSDITEAIEKSRATIYSVIPGIRVLGLPKKEQYSRARLSFENEYQAWHLLEGNNRILKYFPSYLQNREAQRLVLVQTAMFKVAELSGGSTGFIEKPEDAESVYLNIFNEISNRYTIGYYPTNQEQDGKRRTVKIEVRGHPEYIVTGRKTYITSEQKK